jgi:hypothetical protein
MIARDYLIRQFEELARVIAEIMGLSAQRHFVQAVESIDRHGKAAVGAVWEMLELIDDARLIDVLRQADNAEHWAVTAHLLKAKAEVLRQAGEMSRAQLLSRRAVMIAAFLKNENRVDEKFIHPLINPEEVHDEEPKKKT